METRFDPDKDKANIAKHGVSLEQAFEMDLHQALTGEDTSASGEQRFQAIGPIDGRLHVLVYTERPNGIRPISLRRAEKSEIRRYIESWG